MKAGPIRSPPTYLEIQTRVREEGGATDSLRPEHGTGNGAVELEAGKRAARLKASSWAW